MADAVNGANSSEFAKNDDTPAKDTIDDATAGNDAVPEVKDEDADVKEDVNLEWENNANAVNGSASNNSMVSVNNFSLEDMPIIILQQPNKELKIVQTKKIVYMCKICRANFPTAKILEDHLKLCKIIGCPLCNFRTISESLFKEHWQIHQDANQVSKVTGADSNSADKVSKNFVCPNCCKKYKTGNHLMMHMFKCEKTRCRLCEYETYKSYELRRHFLNTHIKPEENIRVCPRCKKVLKNKHSLSTHMWICGKKPRVECHDCGYKTFNKYNLRAHILAKHLILPFPENNVFRTVQTEKVVMPLVVDSDPVSQKVPDNPLAVCGFCKKGFTTQRALSAHSIHCKLFKCNKCPYEVFKKAQLKKHVNQNHKAKQPAVINQPDVSSPLPGHHFLMNEPNSSVPISQPDVSSSVPQQPLLISQPNASSSVPKVESPTSQPDVISPIPRQVSPTSQPNASSSVPVPVTPINHQEVSSPEPQPASPMNQDDESLSLPASPMSSQDVSSAFAETEQMCQICYEIFQNKEALLAHALYCQEYDCPHCSYKTYIKADLTNHIIQRHEQPKENKGADCPKCGNHYKNKRVLSAHLSQCKKFIKCSYCPYKTRRSALLQAHVESTHPPKMEVEEDDEEEEEEEEETITCDQCGQALKSNETMRYHCFYCPRKPFLDCNMCSFKTRYALCLKNHVLRVHCQTEQQSYECPKCSGQLRTLEIFKRHLVTCIPQSVLRCSLCTYMTRDPSCLSDHVMDKHYKEDPSDTSDVKLIPCPKCGNKLKNPLSLRSHLMHCEKEPEFACTQCPFKTKTKTVLDRHVRAKHTS